MADLNKTITQIKAERLEENNMFYRVGDQVQILKDKEEFSTGDAIRGHVGKTVTIVSAQDDVYTVEEIDGMEFMDCDFEGFDPDYALHLLNK